MRTVLLLITVVGIFPMLAIQAEETSNASSKTIEGTWTIVSGFNQGKELKLDSDKPLHVIIGRQTIVTLDAEEKEMYKATYQLNASKQPIEIDMTTDLPNKPATKALGILQFDGDRLKLCYTLPGSERPTAFKSSGGSQQMLFEMKQSSSVSSRPTATASAKSNQQVLVTLGNLVGANILNSENASLGEIEKIMISSDRSMTHAVVSVGGLIGLGAEQVAVPLRALRVKPADGEQHASWLQVNIGLKDAPRLETENYLELADPGWLAKNAEYYHVELKTSEKISIIDVSRLIDQEVFGRGGDLLATSKS